ncbi:MAG: lipocalin family protein [Gammaproteobacteria bacterium]|nr:lipocalin family protein [Gammaproteobacteria bacterium]MDH3434257.1 lipocalin family protein [Gammaproteobacteria bacterium]
MNIRKRKRFRVLVALLLVTQTGCSGVPDGVEVVSGFELDRYLGKWYEIARLDHRFERGLSEVTATYSLRDDGGVKVVNRGFDRSANEYSEATGKAYFVGDTNRGQLKVSFFGPFYGGYNIIELDKVAYQYSLVAGPDRSYLWILSRTPEMDPEILHSLVKKANDLGFATQDLILVEHAQRSP